MNRRYLIETILFLSYVMFAATWVAGTMSMREIMTQVGSHSLALGSTLTTALTIAKIAGTACSAYLIVKLGTKHAITLSAVLISIGLITPFVSSYPLLFASRFLVGLGGAFLLVYLNPIAVGWFTGRELTFVNGLNNLAFSVGTVLAMFVVPAATGLTGNWRSGMLLLSGASVVLTILWVLFGRAAALEASATRSRAAERDYRFRDGLKDPFTWLLVFTYSGLLSLYIVMLTFYPTAGITEARAVLVAGVVGGIVGTTLSGRIRRRMLVLRVSGVVQVLAAIGLSFSGTHVIALASAIVLGFVLIFPLATIFTVGQKQPGMTQSRVLVRFSIFWSACYFVATVVTTLFAEIVDRNHGNYYAAFVFICVISASFPIGSFLLKDRGDEVDETRLAAAIEAA